MTETGTVEVAESVGCDLGHELLHHGGARRCRSWRRRLLHLPADGHLAVGGGGSGLIAAAAAARGSGLLLLGGRGGWGAEGPDGADEAADGGGPSGDQGPETVHADIQVVVKETAAAVRGSG